MTKSFPTNKPADAGFFIITADLTQSAIHLKYSFSYYSLMD